MRTTAKRVVERVLRMALGNPRRMRGRALILAYHNVVPDGEAGLGDRSLHLPWSAFLRQLELIRAHCRTVSLPDLLAGARSPERPTIALTFDDAYRGAIELAVPELQRRGIPVTLFVAPGLLGTPSFWWDELASGSDGLPDAVRAGALHAEAGRQERIRARMGAQAGVAALPSSYGCASEHQVRDVGRLDGVTLGAHSWSHPNLARIAPADLAAELGRPLRWLEEAAPPGLRVLAYPYGLRSPEVDSAVADAGYTAALLVEGGWLPVHGGSPWTVPRFNVPAGISEDGLLLRLSGTVPL